MNAALKIEKEMVGVGKLKPNSLEPVVERKSKNSEISHSPFLEELEPSSKMYRKVLDIISSMKNRISRMERDKSQQYQRS